MDNPSVSQKIVLHIKGQDIELTKAEAQALANSLGVVLGTDRVVNYSPNHPFAPQSPQIPKNWPPTYQDRIFCTVATRTA